MTSLTDSPPTAVPDSPELPQTPAAPDAPPRLAIAALLLGGLLLLLLGQQIPDPGPDSPRLGIYLLQGLGLLAFLAGGRAAMRGDLSTWLQRVLDPLAAWLEIQTGQVILLLLAPAFALLALLASGEGLLARSAPVALAAWLLAGGCAVGGAIRPAQEKPLHIPTSEILFTAVLFAAAFLLRGLATDAIPTTFSGDEGSAGLSAVEFITGKANNTLAVAWFDFPALYFALQSLFIRALGQTVPALRLFAALGGALTVVATYWLGRVTLGVWAGRLAGVFLAVSHYHIHMSRIGLNNIWDGLFAAAAAAGLWLGWQYDRRLGFIIAGVALGLGQYFYVSMRIVPLLFLIWAAAALLVDRARFRARLPGLALSAFIAAVIFLPLGLFYADHPDQFAARMRFVSIFGPWLENEMRLTGDSTAVVLGRQTLTAAAGLVSEPLRHWYQPGVPLLLGAGAALFVAGLFWALLNFDLAYLLLLLPVAATIMTVALSQDAPAAQRYVLAAPFVAVFVALPLVLLTHWLRREWPRRPWLTAVPALLITLWLAFSNLTFYFNQVYDTFVLGGTNTVVATHLARTLAAEPPGDVYFFGFPRMGYRSHGTVPYLAPHMNGIDIEQPLTSPWTTHLTAPTDFIFLPERLPELDLVRQTYPGGRYEEFRDRDGALLFARYHVGP